MRQRTEQVNREGRAEHATYGERASRTPTGALPKLTRRLIEIAFLTWCTLGAYSCVASRPEKCSFASECEQGFCDSQGFCQSECKADHDCPCGSTCAPSCGICVRNDDRGQGPATCFPLRNGLDTRDVLGVCRADLGTQAPVSPQVMADGGVCVGPPVTLPECPSSPLAQRFLPSGGAGGTDGAGGTGGGGTGGIEDAGPDPVVDSGDDASGGSL